MAIYEVALTKGSTFKEKSGLEWTNVYTLSTPGLDDLDAEAAIDSLVRLERPVHATDVTFVRATVYERATLSTRMIPLYGKALEGVGEVSTGAIIYKECCVLVQWELPRAGGLSGIGRSRRLSKWLHVNQLASSNPGASVLQGAGAFPATLIDIYLDLYANPAKNQTHGGGKLSNPRGIEPVGVKVVPHVQHHQFHRGT
jgi:hypothetical protein